MEDIHQILRKYWGYTTFRPLQEPIISAILQGKDVLALLPTGGGKSICFQVPTLARPGLCIVITPLIALMKDQTMQLKKRNIAAEAIHTGMSQYEIDVCLDNCIYGPIKFLYVSPERLQTETFQARLQNMQVSLIAVDEAHCISQWGYDFRPAYLTIAALREWLPNVNIVALTATATDDVKKDIQDKLLFQNSVVFQQSFSRTNLHYLVKKTEDKYNVLVRILKKIPGSAIIYVNSRKKTKQISQYLTKNDIQSTYYHGGLGPLEREKKQHTWTNNHINCIVATNAFGMGIDKPDVRVVIHLDLPTTLEAYYQEAGRAGRDELTAYAILLYDEQDIADLRENIQQNNPSIDELKKCYQQLVNYYQLGTGTTPAGPYTFEWEKFATTMKRPLAATYPAIQRLAVADIIALNEAFEEKAHVLLHIHHQELYQLLTTNYPYQPLLQALIRLYGGELFSDYCKISENQLATYLQITTDQVKEQLHKLQQADLLTYQPPRHQPQITFLYAHLRPHQVPLPVKDLKEKAKKTIQKAEAVVHYITHQNRCREQLLLEYFNEISYRPCTHCDRCQARADQEKDTNLPNEAIEQIILARLETTGYFPSELIDQIEAPETMLVASIKNLLEKEQITYDKAQRLIKKQTNS